MKPVVKFDVHHPQDSQIGQMEAHVFELPTGQARVEFYYPWGGSYIQEGSDRYYEPFLAHSVDSAINSLEIIYGKDKFIQSASRRRRF